MSLLDDLDDPKKQFLLMAGLGLLGGGGQQRTSVGQDMMRGGLMGMQAYNSAQQDQRAARKDEREARANDIAQISGTINALQSQEFQRLAEAARNKQPYAPSPLLGQLNSRLASLVSEGNLSGRGMPQTQQPQGLPQVPPQQSVPSGPPGQNFMGANPDFNQAQLPQSAQPRPQQMPQQSPAMGGFGGPAGGMPMEAWLAADRTGAKYMEQLAKDNAPQNVRAGATLAGMDANGTYRPLFQAPVLGPGIQSQRNAKGDVTGASEIPGYSAAAAALAKMEAAAKGEGAAPTTFLTIPGANRMVSVADAAGIRPTQPNAPPSSLPQLGQQPQGPQIPGRGMQGAGLSGPDPVALAKAEAEGKGMGDVYAKAYSEMREASAGAPYQKAMLEEMRGLANGALSGQTGALTAFKQKVGEWMMAGGATPEKVNSTLNIDVPSAQEFVKLALSRAMAQTRTMGAREAASVFQSVQQANPNVGLSTEGINKIIAPLIAEQDWNMAKHGAADEWIGKKGTLGGFESDWNKSQPFGKFWKNAQLQAGQPGPGANDPLVVTDPNGKQHRFPSAAAAQYFRKSIGQ